MALKPRRKAKDAKAKATKTGTKKATAKAKKTTAKYAAGDVVQFKGYIDNQDEPMFETGEALLLTKVKKRDGETRLEAIRVADKEAFEADPEDVDGDELLMSEVAKSKGKLPAVVKEDPPIKDVGALPELLKKNKGNVVATAQGLLEDAGKNYFYFGGLMAHAHKEKVFVKQGYEDSKKGFYEFCQTEFGMDGRKVYTWIDTYRTFSELPRFSEKKLAGIGWSKAAEVAKYATEENVDELVDLAKEQPISDLKATLKSDYVTEGRTASGRESRSAGSIKRTEFKFKLFEDQADGVQMALDSACKTLGMDLNQVFEHVVMEWAQEHLTENQAKAAVSAKRKKQRKLKKEGIAIPTDEERIAA